MSTRETQNNSHSHFLLEAPTPSLALRHSTTQFCDQTRNIWNNRRRAAACVAMKQLRTEVAAQPNFSTAFSKSIFVNEA